MDKLVTKRKNEVFSMVWLKLDDLEWLQTMLDLEDMGYYDSILRKNIKYKSHLETDKRALFLQHLQYEN